jgi:hypothetical protein
VKPIAREDFGSERQGAQYRERFGYGFGIRPPLSS